MKLISYLTAMALIISGAFVQCRSDQENHYKAELSQMIREAGIPIIQIEYNAPGKHIGEMVVNSAFYPDSTSISPNSVFQAASLSKVVFAYIVMKMVGNGEIDLDTPLYKYTDINRFADTVRAKKLTARMILTHRSGLPDWAFSPSSDQWPESEIRFVHEPDSCYGYSGEGFAFLQRAVEAIKGKGIQEIAQEEVFIPLDMPNTAYSWLPQYDSLAVDGYNAAGENRGRRETLRANVAYTLRTNAQEYSRFLKALMDGTGLKPEIHSMMLEPCAEYAKRYADQPRDCDSTVYWCLGLGIEQNPVHGKMLWHWGDNGNFKALFVIIPQTQETLVYFTNSSHGHDIIDKITRLFFNDPAPLAISEWITNEIDEE